MANATSNSLTDSADLSGKLIGSIDPSAYHWVPTKLILSVGWTATVDGATPMPNMTPRTQQLDLLAAATADPEVAKILASVLDRIAKPAREAGLL